jgi:hypothetical protein
MTDDGTVRAGYASAAMGWMRVGMADEARTPSVRPCHTLSFDAVWRHPIPQGGLIRFATQFPLESFQATFPMLGISALPSLSDGTSPLSDRSHPDRHVQGAAEFKVRAEEAQDTAETPKPRISPGQATTRPSRHRFAPVLSSSHGGRDPRCLLNFHLALPRILATGAVSLVTE